MKKLLILVTVLLLLCSQTVFGLSETIVSENFDLSTDLPDGWSMVPDPGNSTNSVSVTADPTGALNNKVLMICDNINSASSEVIVPITTSDSGVLTIDFDHYENVSNTETKFWLRNGNDLAFGFQGRANAYCITDSNGDKTEGDRTTVGSFSANTWYHINIIVNTFGETVSEVPTGQAKITVTKKSDGSEVGTWTSSFSNARTKITSLRIWTPRTTNTTTSSSGINVYVDNLEMQFDDNPADGGIAFINEVTVSQGNSVIESASELTAGAVNIECRVANMTKKPKDAVLIAVLYTDGFMKQCTGAFVEQLDITTDITAPNYAVYNLPLNINAVDLGADSQLMIYMWDSLESGFALCDLTLL